jgi:hypothetical protein
VEKIREDFVIGGSDFALKDGEYLSKPKSSDGKQEVFLIATTCSSLLRAEIRWIIRSLAEYLLKVCMVD